MMRQFDIYWVNLDPTQGSEIAKTRPCVIISPDEMNESLRTVIIIPITSAIKKSPFRICCSIKGKPGEIATDHMRAVDKKRLDMNSYSGQLSSDERRQLQHVLNEMFCL